MPSAVTLKTIGNWRKEVGVPLKDALHTYMDVTGKTGERACRKAIVEMAKAAKALTPKAKKNRKVQRNEHGRFVDVYGQRSQGAKLWPLYQWAFSEDNPDALPGTWEQAKRIGNQGLAKRSWMWGLDRLGLAQASKPMRGVVRLTSFVKENVGGYILTNKLDYLLKILPSGWEASVLRSAGNRIMGESKRKLERDQKRAVLRHDRKVARGMSQFFLKGLT